MEEHSQEEQKPRRPNPFARRAVTTDQPPAATDERARESAHPTHAQEPVHPPAHGEDWDQPWVAPSNLDAPPPLPGMVQRWIRTHVRDREDMGNVQKAFREGWRPRPLESVPDGFPLSTISEGKYAGYIGVHGMILCHMPISRLGQRSRYYKQHADMQMQRVLEDLREREHDALGPILRSMKSKVVKGRRRPEAQQELDDGIDRS